MKPAESFPLRWQDLVIMGRNETMITSVKTFDQEVGRVTKEGIMVKEEGVNASTKEPYTMIRLWQFRDFFPKIKSITQRRNDDEKFKQKEILVADRRYLNQRLMTLCNGHYKRPHRSHKRTASLHSASNKVQGKAHNPKTKEKTHG